MHPVDVPQIVQVLQPPSDGNTAPQLEQVLPIGTILLPLPNFNPHIRRSSAKSDFLGQNLRKLID